MTDLTELRTESQAAVDKGLRIGYYGLEAAAEIAWLRSSIVALLTLAEAQPSPLTPQQVVSICKVTMSRNFTPIVVAT